MVLAGFEPTIDVFSFPDFMISGVPSNSVVDVFGVKFRSPRPEAVHSLAADGGHVYMQTSQGLFKVGSGYAGTIKVRKHSGQK
jgi:hypothetical protein